MTFFNSNKEAVNYLREKYGIKMSINTIPKLVKEKALRTVPVPGKNKNLITSLTVDRFVAETYKCGGISV